MTAHDWSPPYPAWVYVALAAGAVAFLLLARRLAGTPTARSWLLLLLRAGVLGLLALILLNLIRATETRLPPRTPEVVYLVDCSRSMALDRPTSRLEQVKQVIARAASQPPSGPPPRTTLYRFGDRLTAVSRPDELSPTDDATRLLDALERLPSHFSEGRPATDFRSRSSIR